jgi:hypothetical protein
VSPVAPVRVNSQLRFRCAEPTDVRMSPPPSAVMQSDTNGHATVVRLLTVRTTVNAATVAGPPPLLASQNRLFEGAFGSATKQPRPGMHAMPPEKRPATSDHTGSEDDGVLVVAPASLVPMA